MARRLHERRTFHARNACAPHSSRRTPVASEEAVMRLRPAVAALVAAGTLAACSGIPSNFLDPEVSLSAVEVRGLGLTGGTLDLHVDVYNPNNFDLRGTRLELGFEVDSQHVGDISYREEFRVQDGDTSRVVLPLRFSWTGANAAARAAMDYGDIPYTMRGQVYIQTPFGERVVPFTRRGRAPLTRR